MTPVKAGKTKSAGKGALAYIFSVILLDLVGMTILFPVTAFIMRQYSSDALMVSLMTASYAAAQFVGAPILGKLSDRFGRRPVLLISILGSAIGYFLFGIGGALWVLFLSRLIDGLTGGNISTASAYIADITPPEKRAKNFALVGIAFGLGFVLGPALGGVLSQISLAAPAYASGGLSLLSAVTGFFILPESLPVEKRSKGAFRWSELNPFSAILELLRRPGLGSLLIAQSIFLFVFNGNNSILPVLMIDRFGALPGNIALLIAAGGVVNIIVQGGLVGRLAPRFGEKNLTAASLAIHAAASIVIVFISQFWMMFPTILFSSIGNALFWPTIGALLANSVSPEEQGKLSGVSTALSGLTSMFGPLWAGSVYDTVSPAAPYAIGAALVALAFLGLVRSRPDRVQASETEAAVPTV